MHEGLRAKHHKLMQGLRIYRDRKHRAEVLYGKSVAFRPGLGALELRGHEQLFLLKELAEYFLDKYSVIHDERQSF